MKAIRTLGFAALAAVAALALEIIVSSVCTTLFFRGVFPQTYETCVGMAALTFAIFALALVGGIILLNVIYGKKGYALASLWILIAYVFVLAIVIATTLLMTVNGDSAEPVYTHLFLGYKVYAFGAYSRFFSALVTNIAVVITSLLTAVLCGVVNFILRKYR